MSLISPSIIAVPPKVIVPEIFIVEVIGKLTVEVIGIDAPKDEVDKNEIGIVPVWLAATVIDAPRDDVVGIETPTEDVVNG